MNEGNCGAEKTISGDVEVVRQYAIVMLARRAMPSLDQVIEEFQRKYYPLNR